MVNTKEPATKSCGFFRIHPND